MIKYIFITALLCAATSLSAQNVGIGTPTPTAALHIKSDKPYIMRIEDDINTDNEQFSITASSTDGQLLKTPTQVFRKIEIGKLSTSPNTIGTSWVNSGTTITLPVGRWLVQSSMALISANDLSSFTGSASGVVEVRASLADSGTAVPTADIEGDTKGSTSGNGFFFGQIFSPKDNGLMKGMLIINNTSGATKTYDLIARIVNIRFPSSSPQPVVTLRNFSNSTQNQNQIFALPLY